MIQVGGYRPSTVIDFEIPKRYGLRQTIGDTLGIGGIMRALRTIPVMLDFGRHDGAGLPGRPLPQLHESDGDALHGDEPGDGDPHRRSLSQRAGTAADLAEWLGVPADEVNYLCAGINHVAFYLRFERMGKTSIPRCGSWPMSDESRPGNGSASRSSDVSAISSPSRASISPSMSPGSSSRVAMT